MVDYEDEIVDELNDEDERWVLTPKSIFYFCLRDSHIIDD